MNEAMATIIIERMVANGFTNERALDAVNHVRDTYEGWDKVPNIANFIQFDRRIKLYTHAELCDGAASWDDCDPVRIDGLDKPRWALKEDVRHYRLEKWDPKNTRQA